MKSFIAVLVAAALVCTAALPASAMPVDKLPRPVAHIEPAGPTARAADDGTPAIAAVPPSPSARAATWVRGRSRAA
jgi:hypothetical protein